MQEDTIQELTKVLNKIDVLRTNGKLLGNALTTKHLIRIKLSENTLNKLCKLGIRLDMNKQDEIIKRLINKEYSYQINKPQRR